MSGRKNEREDEFHFYKNTVSCVRFKGMPCLQGNYFEEVKSFLKNGHTRKIRGRISIFSHL
jgi:hypothetical protein